MACLLLDRELPKKKQSQVSPISPASLLSRKLVNLLMASKKEGNVFYAQLIDHFLLY